MCSSSSRFTFHKRIRKTVVFVAMLSLQSGIVLGHEGHSDLRNYEVAGVDPDRIFLSFHGDPATSRAVTWRTDASVGSAMAQIAVATAGPDFADSAKRVPAVTESVDLQVFANNKQGTVNYHSVVFDGLEPETLYAYRVGDGRTWSEWIQFRTASTEKKPFSFVYFGDAQNEILSKWSRVIRMSYQKAPEAHLAIHAGDLVNNGHEDTEWAEWFKAGSFIHAQRTGIPAIGNHEIRPLPTMDIERALSIVWRPQFTLPEVPSLPDSLQETVYSVDYQGVRFIVLNSLVEVEAQTAYLEQELQRPGADWTVLVSHYSIFSPRPNRGKYKSSLLWQPLLEKYGVDLVLQGHDHLYARGHVPVRSVDDTFGDDFQTLYVTSVSGPKQYAISQEQLATYTSRGYRPDKQAEQKQFFQVIEVDGTRLLYTAYTADGEIYDQAAITKDPETGVKTLENLK
jgi:3',5'-cyclic AMP phosphodiesterase CpdA